MRRRNFIAGLASVTTAWPVAARAQQPEKMRRIGVLMSFAAEDAVAQARLAEFQQALQQLGWMDGVSDVVAVDHDGRQFQLELLGEIDGIELLGTRGSSILGYSFKSLQRSRGYPGYGRQGA